MERNPRALSKVHIAYSPIVEVNANMQFRDLSLLTTLLSSLLWAGASLHCLSLAFWLMEFESLSHSPLSPLAASSVPRLGEFLIRSSTLLWYIDVLFVFGRWMHIANRNLPALGAQNLRFRPHWVVASFAIPIVNLYAPYGALCDLLQASEAPSRWRAVNPPWWTDLWWLLWILTLIVDNYLLRALVFGTPPSSASDLTILRIASCALIIPLCLMTRLIILRVHKHQAAAWAGMAESSAQ